MQVAYLPSRYSLYNAGFDAQHQLHVRRIMVEDRPGSQGITSVTDVPRV